MNKIIIDCSNLRVGGGIQVAASFINDIANNNLQADTNFYVFSSQEMFNSICNIDFTNNIKVIKFPKITSRFILIRILYCYYFEFRLKPNLIYVVFGPSYHWSFITKIVGFARPHYIYEDSPYFKRISTYLKIKNYLNQKLHLFALFNFSNVIITETEDASSKLKIKKMYKGQDIFVVPNTINSIFLESAQNLYKYNKSISSCKDEFKILCVSSNYDHKNLDILKKVADLLLTRFDFKNFKFFLTLEKYEFQIDDHIEKHFELLGKVSLNELPECYLKSNIFILPTLLEVFSTSYLEAMQMKIPILTSDISFARDVCFDAAIYFNPLSEMDISEKIMMLYNSAKLREELINNGVARLEKYPSSLNRSNSFLKIINKYAK